MTSETSLGALTHIKVLDLSRVLAGPWCTQMLADMGADVVKFERPGEGDDTRHWGPPFLKDAQGNDTPHASYFTTCNRNKRSVTLDIAKPEGQAIIRQMAAQCDVLVENFKVGGLAHYGLDYVSLKAINPRLIYCSITGFGQTGPYAERAGYDLMIQAMSGMMSITGKAEGTPGGGPQRVGVALTDICMAILANQAAGYLNTGKVPMRQGNSHPSLAPYQDFPTADGSMLLAIGNDGQFSRFCHAAGKPEWAHDERYAGMAGRVHNRVALIADMEEITRTRTTAQWIELLEDKAVPCGPINDIGQAFADEQVKARGLWVKQAVIHAGIEKYATETVVSPAVISSVASPLRLMDNPPVLHRPPPGLGEHTDEVLAELGLTPEQIAGLKKAGIV
jgi:formyl-CoA transferase